jgi:hypothetical protein
MISLSEKRHNMKLDNIYKKIIELKFKAHTENVKLEIQKLNQKLSEAEEDK